MNSTRPVEPFHIRSARASLAACMPDGVHADENDAFRAGYLASALRSLLARIEQEATP